MLVDARRVPSGQTMRADVCIVGAGAAGLTLARRLTDAGRDVCVLESGGFEPEADTQRLYDGAVETAGPAPPSRYLTRSRLRYFGGSTNHWTGYCRPLDASDFDERPWIPHSGWPFPKTVLAPHYAAAGAAVEVEPFDDERDEGRGWDEDTILTAPGAFVTKRFHLSPPTRFGRRDRVRLTRASGTRVVHHANVVGLDANASATRVDRLRVATLTGARFEVEARVYVLATGGIENARLLLISDRPSPRGLGNDHDLVGRFFMEHPHLPDAGTVVLTRPLRDAGTYSPRRARRAVVCASAALQREHRLLNASVMLNFDMRRDRPPAAVAGVGDLLSAVDGTGGPPSDVAWSGCYVRAEQRPNRDSRVTLSDERDALGVRRAHLAWRMTDDDIDSVRRTLELLGHELGRTGRGRLRHVLSPLDPWSGVRGGDHHLGTTRMSASPTSGVVDPDGRVHGVHNLYVAGSSVFPAAGYANPTLTIVALALRLADHLEGTWLDG